MSEEENELILAQDKAQDKAQDEIVNEKIFNMSEEEKQAIKKFENLLTKHFEDKKIDTIDYLDYFDGITILNLIEKQQKEIEELKDKNKTLEMLLQGNLFEMYNYYKELANRYQANCISKDKIREIKEELDNQQRQWREDRTNKHTDAQIIYARDVLEELLGETND